MRYGRVTSNPGEKCEQSLAGYHNWLVYQHNRGWSIVGCHCTRCGARCTMSERDYVAVGIAAEKAWAAYVANWRPGRVD